jgi:sugar lactone lactonase YvrE
MPRILPLAVLFLLLGCAGPRLSPGPAPDAAPCWPGPPEPARIRFVRSISGAADLGIREGWLRRLAGEPDDRRLERPCAVAVDAAGRLFVADQGGALFLFDAAGGHARRQPQGPEGALVSPVALLIDGDSLLVADSALRAVYLFDRELNPARVLCRGLARPAGLAADPAGGFLVADAGANRVLRLDRTGRERPWTAPDSLQARLNTPTHLCARDGRIVVTDSYNCRLVLLDEAGAQRGAIGQAGTSPGTFARPKGLALDGRGNLFIADALFGNVQVFDPQGRLLLFFGQTGAGPPGDFNLPTGLAIDGQDRLYVADTWNGRVQIFQILANAETQP